MTQGGGVQLTSFLNFLWAFLGVIRFVGKPYITAPRTKLELVNVVSIGCVIQV